MNVSTWNGILNIAKPAGWTSHDVVARVRQIIGQRSVGHAGTLDPMATGVLLVCTGQATRVSEYLMASDKTYRATVRFGSVTDTYDADGEVLRTAPVPELSAPNVLQALQPFVGTIMQAPPAYSALKQNGVPLHQRARRGEEVTVTPRPVQIHRIDLRAWQPPDLLIDVSCGPGTYIRSLAFDLGQALGCGAHLAQLVRLRSGKFNLDGSVSLEALAAAAGAGELGRYLYPLTAALGNLVAVTVDAAQATRLGHGLPIPCVSPPFAPNGYAQKQDGSLIAILAYDAACSLWQPHKVFAPAE